MKKLKTSLVIMLAMIMVVGTQPRTVFADEEENIAKDLSVGVENKENEEKTEKVGSEFVDEGNVASENEGMGTEIVDVENEESVDGGVEAYTESDEVGTNVDEEIPKAGTCGDNLTWTLSDDGILTISGNGPMRDYTREEPGIAVDFPAPQWVQSVIIKDGVTSVGDYAFCDDTNMKDIVMASSITKIGERAFSFCTCLEKIEIPDSVTDIGEGAFAYCEGLKDVRLSENITDIKANTFFLCNLSEIKIPDGVMEIGDNAFAYHSNPDEGNKRVKLPNHLKTIGSNAFFQSGIVEVSIPSEVNKIEYSAFSGNPLEKIFFWGDAPDSVWSESGASPFAGVSAMAYYPANNPTWTADKMQNYGGTLTWMPWNLYIVEEATDSVYVKGSTNGATIKCTEELGKFISVAMDGVILDSSNYTVVEGSTVLTFLSSYLDTLSVGDHVVTLNYTYGSVDTRLTVLENGTNLNTPDGVKGTDTSGGVENTNGTSDTSQSSSMQGGAPKTGDSTKMVVWLFVTVIAGSGCFVLLYVRRKTYLKF